ncbi:uncharacterized protein FIBRA_07621 [Fibroporia radiculosa]|uniref:SGTA homodimerisation domain-containing protein n=1 Tax=Fibroporia radiculosa TaxID=599839 RepID=J4GVC6_9APHY|nr:uncharacterized protein FIBRA_07621 [Fibroporia radiculosa]CCM05405.1 predicted protein [Fibroporia radiculosa]
MASKQTSKSGGRDPFVRMPDTIKNVLSSYGGGPYANNMEGLMNHLATQDLDSLEALLASVSGMSPSADQLERFDYTTAPVRRDSFWVVQLTPMGFLGQDGHSPGSQPIFSITIYDDILFGAEEPTAWPAIFRLRIESSPTRSSHTLMHSGLSWIRSPILSSWRLETPEETEEVATGVHGLNVAGVAKGIVTAESEKALGNEAVGRKDRAEALKHYTEAIENLVEALAQKPTDAETKRCKNLLSVCLSNRAAAHLLEGDGRDPKKALEDAEQATEMDGNYGKAYYRQAKAYQFLSEPPKAIDVLTTALRKPSIASDKGLNDALVDAYGGFPEDDEELRKFCRELFVNGDGDKRARGLSEFERRAEAHANKVLGAQISVKSL